MDLRRPLLVLRGGAPVIALAVVAGLVVAALAFLLEPRVYRATAVTALTLQGGAAGTEPRNDFAMQAVDSYARVATTPYVLDRVRTRLGLDVSRADLESAVHVTPAPDTAVLTIAADGRTPQQAAAIANAVAAEVAVLVPELTPGDATAAVRATQLQQAIPPAGATSPNGPLFLLIGGGIGLLVGIAVVAVREVSTARIRTGSEAEDALDSLVLAEIPAPTRADPAGIAVAPGASRPRAEAYRVLRTTALRVLEDTGLTSLVVSGTDHAPIAETAANLALALRDAGRDVLLVDGDLRTAAATRLLGLPRTGGLAAVLAGGSRFEEEVRTTTGGLPVLPAAPTEGASDLLQSAPVAGLLATAGRRYEVVIVAAPPLPRVTDAAILGAVAGGALLVVPLDGTPRGAAIAAASAIERAGGRVVGLVAQATGPLRRPALAHQRMAERAARTSPQQPAISR